MKALTVKQPWASLIMGGHKRVENRTWRTHYRGPLVIHAGAAVDRASMHLADRYEIDTPKRVFLGVVDLYDCHRMPDLDWCDCDQRWADPHAWHWCLRNVRPFAEPEPGKGLLGLWTPPQRVELAGRLLRAGLSNVAVDPLRGDRA